MPDALYNEAAKLDVFLDAKILTQRKKKHDTKGSRVGKSWAPREVMPYQNGLAKS